MKQFAVFLADEDVEGSEPKFAGFHEAQDESSCAAKILEVIRGDDFDSNVEYDFNSKEKFQIIVYEWRPTSLWLVEGKFVKNVRDLHG